MTTALYAMMAGGALSLVLLFLFHQRVLPLERILLDLPWEEADIRPSESEARVDLSRRMIRVVFRDGVEHEFAAAGIKLTPERCAVIHVGQRRLLALLDRGHGKRTYIVDTERAAHGGAWRDGVLGWWRHGTGTCLAEAGGHLVEAHRCFGRDRIYWIDPLRAMSGHALARGIERTITAPTKRLDWIEYTERQIRVGRGDRAWRTALTVD